ASAGPADGAAPAAHRPSMDKTDAKDASGAANAPSPGDAMRGADAKNAADRPERDLERLLDRFRDDVRDVARDHGVTAAQLGEVRRHLSTAAAHITALLHTGSGGGRDD
ncbi:PadR family transcriptional regulator, partial [Streptomyces fuscigenes]|nr:PadR family transcriptional regulator [Streptomyces fuscigenes]